MTPEQADAAAVSFREDVLAVAHDAFAALVLGLAILILLSAVRTVRHW